MSYISRTESITVSVSVSVSVERNSKCSISADTRLEAVSGSSAMTRSAASISMSAGCIEIWVRM